MNFFKQTLASLIGTLAGLLLFVPLGASSLVLLLIALSSLDGGPTVKNKSVLTIDLATQIRDTDPPLSLIDTLSNDDATVLPLRQVLQAIEKATKDDRIQTIFLDGSNGSAGTGYATYSEIRQALEQFRAAGKKIIAYDIDLSEQEYYLSSLADTVIVHPMGQMELNGLALEPLFWTGALDKYGIGAQVVRVGTYKGAVEPFIRTDLSPENRQQLQLLVDDLWQNFLTKVQDSRQVSPQTLQQIADTQGVLTPQEALKLGLIDEVGYRDQVLAKLKELTNTQDQDDKSLPQVSLNNYINIPLQGFADQFSNNQIAVVYLDGPIVDGSGDIQQVGGIRFAKLLRNLRQDDNTKAVVVRINSPGGSATASDIILRELQLIQEQKPVIVSMGDVAASGGYWIATGGKYIFAQPNTLTGSIGVFGILLNIQELANNNGITWDTVKTANLANLGTATRPKTAQELAIYQRSVNQVYNLFLQKVAKSRNLPLEKVAQLAQGRVWSGEDAKKLGLVDSMGGLDAAIAYAVGQANLGVDQDWQLQEYPQRRSLGELFFKKALNNSSIPSLTSLDPLTAEFLKFKEDLSVLGSLNDPKGIYSRLPFNWELR